ncbi:MAG: hypothetical protein NT075_16815 [Chloroflexi bacterium]|nr:hypothetical protein [Chloroflexota bacterium]
MTKTQQNKMETMDDRKETIQHYVSDMIATEKHIQEAVKRQIDDESVKEQPEARELVSQIAMVLQSHISQLEKHEEQLGGGGAGIKDAVTSTLGVMAGLYDKVRSKQVSRMLRDDYTALNLAAISYTMLHTTALGLNDRTTADVALRNLKDITPLVTQINQVIPQIVTRELLEDHPGLSMSSGQEAKRNTQEAWSADHIKQRA